MGTTQAGVGQGSTLSSLFLNQEATEDGLLFVFPFLQGLKRSEGTLESIFSKFSFAQVFYKNRKSQKQM